MQYHPDILNVWAAAERRRLKKKEKNYSVNISIVNDINLVINASTKYIIE